MSLLISLAWPLVTLAIALIFRREVTRALGRVGRLKYRDLEVTFTKDLVQAEKLAEQLPPVATVREKDQAKESILLEIGPGQAQPFVRPPSTPEASRSLRELADRSPRMAIETAWQLVDRSRIRSANQGHLAESEARLVGLLRTLRDRACRADLAGPTASEARRFVDLACPLASRIARRS